MHYKIKYFIQLTSTICIDGMTCFINSSALSLRRLDCGGSIWSYSPLLFTGEITLYSKRKPNDVWKKNIISFKLCTKIPANPYCLTNSNFNPQLQTDLVITLKWIDIAQNLDKTVYYLHQWKWNRLNTRKTDSNLPNKYYQLH